MNSSATMTAAPLVSDSILSPDQLKIISIIDMITSSLSILGAGSIIITAVSRRRVCMPEVHPIFELSCADFLASFTLCLSAGLYLRPAGINIDNVCPLLNSISMALYVITFLLTMMYAIEVFRRMRMRLIGIQSLQQMYSQDAVCRISKMGVAYFIVWALPLLTAVLYPLLSRSHNNMRTIVPASHPCRSCIPIFHYNEDICWQGDQYMKQRNIAAKYLFLLPLTIVIVVNFVFYILTIYVFRQTQLTRGVLGYHQYKEEKRIRNKAILYQSVFLFCWLPTLILGFVSLGSGFNMSKFMWLYVVQACVSPLQGFFNSIIYGWKRQGFTQAMYETAPLSSAQNLPSYSSYSL